MSQKFLIPALICACLLFSCKKPDNPVVPQKGDNAYLNVSYGPDTAQRMDVYLPANRSAASTPLMVIVHGGGWSGGDKAEMNAIIDSFRARLPDWAFINLNYRLGAGNLNHFPTQEKDVKAAIEFIYGKLGDYNISNRWVYMGASAGGHLVLLEGNKYRSPMKPRAVINYFGPSDMVELYNHPASILALPSAVLWMMDGTPVSNPTLYFESSPINYISPQSPPTITFQGGLDPLVSPNQQNALHEKLTAAGVPNRLKIYPYQYHGWAGPDLTDSFDSGVAFIKQYVP